MEENLISTFVFIQCIKLEFEFHLADKVTEENDRQEDDKFQKVYKKWKGTDVKDKDVTYKVIPKFYFKVRGNEFFYKTKSKEKNCKNCNI